MLKTFIVFSLVCFVFAVYTAIKTIVGLAHDKMSRSERFGWYALIPASAFVMVFYTFILRIL